MSGAAEEKRKSGPAVRGELQIAHEGLKGNSREEKGKSNQETTMVLENYR